MYVFVTRIMEAFHRYFVDGPGVSLLGRSSYRSFRVKSFRLDKQYIFESIQNRDCSGWRRKVQNETSDLIAER